MFLNIVIMKRKHYSILFYSILFYSSPAVAQWNGPVNGQLSTSNSVKISQLGTGTGTPLPMLSLSHEPGIGEYFPLYVTQTRVGVGTNNPLADFHLANMVYF